MLAHSLDYLRHKSVSSAFVLCRKFEEKKTSIKGFNSSNVMFMCDRSKFNNCGITLSSHTAGWLIVVNIIAQY